MLEAELIGTPTSDAPVPAVSSRRLAMEEARRSKRPSRADRRAGTTEEPDRTLSDAGFQELLKKTLAEARTHEGLPEMVNILLTLNGHLPAEYARRSLSGAETLAIDVLTRDDRVVDGSAEASTSVFTSAFALSPHGRLVVTVPGRRSLPPEAAATGVAARIAWSAADLDAFHRLAEDVRRETEREISECRTLLADLGTEGRAAAVDALRSAVFLVPPVMFYRDDVVYSNLRAEPGNLTGKTLLPTHPDCFFHHLDKLPFDLWTDTEAVIVCCLWLLYRSGGPNRLESSNGFQLTLRNVTDNLLYQCRLYAEAGRLIAVPDADAPLPAARLADIADELAAVRADLVSARRLHYEINATTRRKQERLLPSPTGTDRTEQTLRERLNAVLPERQNSLAAVLEYLRAEPTWLAAPTADAPTGFEAVIETTVRAAREVTEADFAMSRGIRSLPALVSALARKDWEEIVSWELPSFYCCVVPGRQAADVHEGDLHRLADSMWAIAARMQYNTWHVMPGNLPKDPAVLARDFLAPHVLPDIALHSDLHHRGHITNLIRYSARSPETVRISGFPFRSLTDIRVLRCEGPAFTAAELGPVTMMARFVAQVCELVADAAARDVMRVEVTSFDHRWYHRTVIEEKLARHD